MTARATPRPRGAALAVLVLVAWWAARCPGAVAPTRGDVSTPVFTAAGVAAEGGRAEVSYLAWDPPVPSAGAAPVLLIHGSPGAADNFSALGPLIAARGRRVVAIDLPGFGRSTRDMPDLSTRAHARHAVALLDALGIERAHVVGWSLGGGVALEMIDLSEGRVGSLVLLGSVGAQETEGSGSYAFEHAKYALGIAAARAIGSDTLLASMRNFFDTDQRPYAAMMRRLRTPLLILHGRRDVLVSDRAAERHHEIAGSSSLLMTPHGHFLPFLQPRETDAWLAPFFARHDEPGVEPVRARTDLAPRPRRVLADGAAALLRLAPWWLTLAAFAWLARARLDLAAGLMLVLVADQSLDLGVAAVALLVGNIARPRAWWETTRARRALPRLIWPGVVAAVMVVVTPAAVASGLRDALVTPVDLFAVAGASLALATLRRGATREGRQRLRAAAGRWTHHEWWPTWLLYAGVVPHIVRLALRHGPLTWTCANPGLEPGGGVLGERKSVVLDGFGDAQAGVVLPAVPLPASGAIDDRLRESVRRIEADPRVGGFPCVVKPQTGYRGVGVRVVRDEAGLRTALAAARRELAAQRYHPGPHELGVFWVRDPSTVGREGVAPPPHGRIYAVTRKTFPEVVGDGRRRLRALIMDHPRFRKQAAVYFRENAGRLSTIIAEGEAVVLTRTGNHMQGCVFTDGMHLVTPALEAAVDALLRSWRGEGARPFDFGRFDLRYSDEASLRAGLGFAIIELNGVTSEATSLYDPSAPYARARGLLRGQWTRLFELGAARRAAGRRPMSPWAIARALLTVRNR